MIGSILIILSIALGLITLVGMLKPGFVMQPSREKVLLLFFVPCVFLMLIGSSLLK